jgi:hypothetical protein
MNKIFATVAAAALLFVAPAVQGQAPGDPEVPSASAKVNLTLEQRHIIKEIVKDLKIAHVPADTDTSVGAVVSKSIPLQPMPAEIWAKVPRIKSHKFFIKDDEVVLVDPRENRIVEVID